MAQDVEEEVNQLDNEELFDAFNELYIHFKRLNTEHKSLKQSNDALNSCTSRIIFCIFFS